MSAQPHTPQPEQVSPEVPQVVTEIIVHHDLIETTPAEAETLRLRAQRKEAIIPLIAEYVPARTDQEIIAEARRKFEGSKKYDTPEDQERAIMENASYAKYRENNDNTANWLAGTEIPLEEMSQWLTGAYEAAAQLEVPGEGTDMHSVTQVLSFADQPTDLLVAREVLHSWQERMGRDLPPQEAASLRHHALQFLYEISGKGSSAQREPRSPDEIRQLFAGYAELKAVMRGAARDEHGRTVFDQAEGQLKLASLRNHDATLLFQGAEFISTVVGKPDEGLGAMFVTALARYAINHGVREDSFAVWQQKLWPAMQRRDPQTELLVRGGNMSGMQSGEFGALDFIVHAYGAEVTPLNINELLMISRDIPTSDLARLEQNRRDALALAGEFRILRDFIHDQRPGVHAVLEAMVNYYESADPSNLVAAMDQTQYFARGNEEYRSRLLDLERYNKVIVRKDKPEGEAALDIIRRLEENTRPVDVHAPEVSDPELHKMMQELEERPLDSSSLERVLSIINAKVADKVLAGELGIEPNDINAISWIEQRCFEKLQSLTFEDQTNAYKLPWFKQVLLFEELTASDRFDPSEFEEWYGNLQKEGGEAAYKQIADRTLGNIQRLSAIYMSKGWNDKVGALWSGNTAHELIGLTDARPASTIMGARLRNERLASPHKRRSGD